jgi:tetraacyldisaccharide 4'-kinase
MNPAAVWYGRHPMSLALLALGWLYCGVARLRRALYRGGGLKTWRLPCPVVVVGNLTVGGTGKTPLVLLVAEMALERGLRPAILIRGYRGRGRDWPRTVTPDDDPDLVGDEPVLLARRGVCPVIAGPDRVADGHLAVARHGCDLIISDDGLQHYRLERDLEVAVIDGERGLGNGRCLPAGPLREPRGRLASVDLVVRNGAGGGGYGFTLEPGAAVNLLDPRETRPLSAFRGLRVTAVAGIGNPGRFFALLRAHGMLVEEWPYPDHHACTPEDLAAWPPGPVLMTEKDAVKCAKFGARNLWYCPVRAVPDSALADTLVARLDSLSIPKV